MTGLSVASLQELCDSIETCAYLVFSKERKEYLPCGGLASHICQRPGHKVTLPVCLFHAEKKNRPGLTCACPLHREPDREN